MKIEAKMKERGLSLTELAEQSGVARKRCKEIIDCESPANAEEARLFDMARDTKETKAKFLETVVLNKNARFVGSSLE